MSWVKKNRKINNWGGGGDDYSGLESMYPDLTNFDILYILVTSELYLGFSLNVDQSWVKLSFQWYQKF